MEDFKRFVRNFRYGFSTFLTSLRTTLPYLVGSGEKFKEVTEEYPDKISARMPEDLPQRYRGFLNNEIEKCSGCRYCSDVCPVDCIKIETEAGPAKNMSWVAVFDIDHSECIFCGLCVESCPTKSLTHTREYQGATFTLKDMISSFGRGWASNDMKKLWEKDQKLKDLQAEEQIMFEQSPVGAELLRRKKDLEGKE